MGMKIFQVDAFTNRVFRGNPAAVCLLKEPVDVEWMASVAAEMNLSETAFVLAQPDGFGLRWFTPTMEVDLCGHATLAAAHILWHVGWAGHGDILYFHTRSGTLTAEHHNGWIELDFPALPDEPVVPPVGLAEALGVQPLYVGRISFAHIVEVDSEDEVRSLVPDMAALKRVSALGSIVTSRAVGKDYDFVSRFFAPAIGIDEDPVTGSSHCCLAPFWAKRLRKKVLTAFQASSRGGVLRVRVDGERVRLAGQAVTVLRGELLADPVVA